LCLGPGGHGQAQGGAHEEQKADEPFACVSHFLTSLVSLIIYRL